MTMTPGRHCSALLLSLLLALLLIMEPASAFLPSGSRLQQATTSTATPLRRRAGAAAAVRMAAEGGDGNEKRELDRLFEEMQRVNSRSSMGEAIKETVDRLPLPTLPTPGSQQPARPFRFPAYGFLLLSAVLGIAFTGNIAELATGHPLLGRVGTLAVVLGSGPSFIATFVIAVTRYNEEKDEDDRRLEEEERAAAAEEQKPMQGPVMAGRVTTPPPPPSGDDA